MSARETGWDMGREGEGQGVGEEVKEERGHRHRREG